MMSAMRALFWCIFCDGLGPDYIYYVPPLPLYVWSRLMFSVHTGFNWIICFLSFALSLTDFNLFLAGFLSVGAMVPNCTPAGKRPAFQGWSTVRARRVRRVRNILRIPRRLILPERTYTFLTQHNALNRLTLHLFSGRLSCSRHRGARPGPFFSTFR